MIIGITETLAKMHAIAHMSGDSKKKYKLEAPMEKDIYGLSKEEKKAKGIKELPGDLYGATLLMEKSELVRKALGGHAFTKFVANRRIEWDNFRVQVTNYELKKYLPIL